MKLQQFDSGIPDILVKILDRKQEEIEIERRRRPLRELRQVIADQPEPRGFGRRLREVIAAGESAVIAEIKKASPSKGVIRDPFDPVAIARSYQHHGASCLSVLTDKDFFQGDDSYLQAVKAATELPVLRKDFILDSYQLYQSRAIGADCVLLIVAALGRVQLADLYQSALGLDLDVLVEVHDYDELAVALELQPELLGINNRSLRTFHTDLQTTIDLLPHVQSESLLVTESGVLKTDDVGMLRSHGVKAFLVGEAFMRQADPGLALAQLFEPRRS